MVVLEMGKDGKSAATERIALTKGATPRLAFRIAGDQPSIIQARLIPAGFDSLAADNAAWLALPAVRPLSVYVPERLASYRHALGVIEGIALFPREGQAAPAAYDLVITDTESDLPLPARVRCTLGFVP